MRKGLVIVNTGDGKGKSTAALGLLMRAWGRGFRVCVIQFVKAGTRQWGEIKAATRLGIEWHSTGDGFTWASRDIQKTAAKAVQGWALAQEKIGSGQYDVIALDELTYPINYGWLDAALVIEWLRTHKPAQRQLVITGRDAPQALVEYADLVTEMRALKHPFEQGVKAQPGIEY